jgi:pimeloyl-ACP methyl ester carboxylesterase
MDYRGHGNSDSPKDYSKLSIETLAKDLKLMMEEAGITEAILLGHSMGVNVVLEFYKQFPKSVKGMVLANGTPTKPLDTLLLSNSLRPAFGVLEKAFRQFPHLSQTLWKYQKDNKLVSRVIGSLGFNTAHTSSEEIQTYVNNIAEIDPKVFLSLIRNYDKYDGMSWLQGVTAPTLVLAGQKDLIIPAEKSQLLHQLIPNSQIEVVPNGSHCSQMDFPDLVNQRIQEFIESIYLTNGSK